MWERKELKREAKGTLKRNYLGILITCTIVAIIVGYFVNPIRSIESFTESYRAMQEYFSEEPVATAVPADETASGVAMADTARQDVTTDDEIADNFLEGVGATTGKHWTKGILAVVANNTQGAGDLIYGILNTINQFVFKDSVNIGIIIAVGVAVTLFILIFIKNVLAVGYCRYLMEIRRYRRTVMNRILFPWYIKRGMRTARAILLKNVYLLLWWFTIIGGVIKSYSYRMVPYIIAENPNIGAREAIKLSREMMDGSKWKAFVLDVSFLPWKILNFLTFNLLRLFFVMPYVDLTNAELYMALRKTVKSDKLCDDNLDVALTDGEYPVESYMIPPYPPRKWAHADYNRKYSITSLILIFFTFSFVGWVWEVSLHLFKDGVFVNRGVMYGPWLPIYGAGGIIVLVVLKKLRDKPLMTFAATMVLCGIVEYFTSWYLEKVNGMRWWDYSGYFMNLNGRICLEGLLVFALGGCAAIYLIAPALDNIFGKMPKRVKITACAVLCTAFLSDATFAHFVPNTGKGITDY